MPHAAHDADARDEARFGLDDVLRHLLAIGAVLVLLLPAARGSSPLLGWLPLWLLVMPAAALWAARGCPLPWRKRAEIGAVRARQRRLRPQARRRVRAGAAAGLSRAA